MLNVILKTFLIHEIVLKTILRYAWYFDIKKENI